MINHSKLFILALLFSGTALADSEVEKWKEAKDEQACGWMVNAARYGIESRLSNIPFEIKDPSIWGYDPTKENQTIPQDAMYYAEWDKLDDESKGFVKSAVKVGWDFADRINKDGEHFDYDPFLQVIFGNCMEMRESTPKAKM